MNLVCYEYIASQQETQGVLILSEFTGAAESLDGCVLFNPWDVFATADTIYDSLQMTSEARAKSHQKLHNYVEKYTAEFWGRSFITDLSRILAQTESAEERQTTSNK